MGKQLSELQLNNGVEIDCLMDGRMEDRYNLWYIKYCPAREQETYNEAGEVRQTDGGVKKITDHGNEGLRLADFTAKINKLLKDGGSPNTVNDDQVSERRNG